MIQLSRKKARKSAGKFPICIHIRSRAQVQKLSMLPLEMPLKL
jgi:hypothetical protein